MGRPRSFHSCCRTSRTPSRQNSALRMSFLPEGWDSSPTANQNGNSSSGGGGGGLQLPGFRFRVEDKFGFGLPKLPIVERLVQSLRCIRPGMMFKRGEEIFVRQAIFYAAATTADATIAALPHALPSWLLPLPAATLSMGLPLSVPALVAQSIAIDLTFSFWACALEIKTSHDVDRLRRLETMLALQECQGMAHVGGTETLQHAVPGTTTAAAPRAASAALPMPSSIPSKVNIAQADSNEDALVKPPEPAIVSAAAYARVSKEFALEGHGCEYGGDGTWRCS